MGFTKAAMLQAGVLVHLVRVDPEVTTCSGQSKQCRVCASGSWLKPDPKCEENEAGVLHASPFDLLLLLVDPSARIRAYCDQQWRP
jgi:hypothetical protein